MNTIGMVLYGFVIAFLLNDVSGEIISDSQKQIVSILNGHLLFLNYSMLSASCANESLQLISYTYDINAYSHGCSAVNETEGAITECRLNIWTESYEKKCKKASGQFYTNQTEGLFYVCGNSNDEGITTFNIGISNYPFCAGISCNDSEVKAAFYETLSADAIRGPISSRLSSVCGSVTAQIETSATGAETSASGADKGFAFVILTAWIVGCAIVTLNYC
jgi:hypothetical protein